MIEPQFSPWFEFRCRSIKELIEIEEYDRAAERLEEMSRSWPDNPHILHLRAEIALSTSDYPEVCRSIEELYRLEPSSYQGIEMMGRLFCMLGYYNSAGVFLQPCSVRPGTEYCASHVYLAFALIMLGDFPTADTLLKYVTQTYGDLEESSTIRGTLLALTALIALSENEIEKASEYAGNAAATEPSAPFVAYANGRVAHAAGLDTDAVRWLKRACEDEPHLMQARWDLINIFIGNGEEEEAEVCRTGLFGFFAPQEDRDDLCLRIRELLYAEEVEKAADLCRSLLLLDPDDRMRLMMGEVFLAAGAGAEMQECISGLSSEPYCMNIIYLKTIAAINDRNSSLALKYIVQASLRDRYLSLFNLYRYANFSGMTDGEEEDPVIHAMQLFCVKGPGDAVSEAIASADFETEPYGAGFAALAFGLNDQYEESFRYADIAASSSIPELSLIRPIIMRYTGFINEAEGGFRAVYQDNPHMGEARLLLARTMLDLGKWGDTFELLWRDGDLAIGLPVYRSMLLEARIRSGILTQSEDITKDMIRETLYRYNDLKTAGHSLILNQEPGRALWCFMESMRMGVRDEDTLTHLLQSLLKTGRTHEAFIHGVMNWKEEDNHPRIAFLVAAAALLGDMPERAVPFIEAMNVHLRSEIVLRDHLQNLSTQGTAGLTIQILADTPAGGIGMSWLGEYAAAADRLEAEIEQIPDDAGIRLAFGECLLHLGRYSDALRQFRVAEGISGAADSRISACITEARSLLYLNRVDPDMLDAVLIPASGGDPEIMVSLLSNLVKRLREAGESEAAREISSRITGITIPERPSARFFEIQAEAFHALGDLTGDTGMYDLAVSKYDAAIRADSGSARLYAGKGIVLCNPGKFKEAEIALREAIRLDPGCGKAYSGLAWCLSNTNRVQEAEFLGDRGVAFSPEDWSAWNNRALARLARGNVTGAESDFRRAVLIAPDEMIAVGNLHHTLVVSCDEEALTVQREAMVRFGPLIAERLSGNYKDVERAEAPIFDYNHPEVW